jgi:glycosyltransferase involved in cell wall biosynthesis
VLALKIAGIHRRVVWQASSGQEKTDIQRTFRRKAAISIAQDIKVPIVIAGPLKKSIGEPDSTPRKIGGQLAIVYLARIHPHKNLFFALTLLKSLRGKVIYDIYGPLEDIEYWSRCEKIINHMPQNIVVRYEGELAHEEVPNCLKKYHVLFLPSKSENYGHSIVESLIGGLPVVISNRTPWQALHESNAGWDIPLSEPNLFISKLQHLIDMGEEEFDEMRKGARSYAIMKCTADTIVQQNRALISAVLPRRKR